MHCAPVVLPGHKYIADCVRCSVHHRDGPSRALFGHAGARAVEENYPRVRFGRTEQRGMVQVGALLVQLYGDLSQLYGDLSLTLYFTRFVGQYSYDPIIRDFDGAPTPLFSNYDSTGQRACTSQGTVDAGDVLLEDDTIVFLKTAPRTAGSLLHPIFQGQGFLGWGGYNITSPEGWYEAPLDASSREIPVIDANGVVVTRIMPPMLRPRGDSAAYRGIESGIVASTVCDRLNHRGAKPNEGPIRMPGLFPRSFDLEYVSALRCHHFGSFANTPV